jgi:hypothetical protein
VPSPAHYPCFAHTAWDSRVVALVCDGVAPSPRAFVPQNYHILDFDDEHSYRYAHSIRPIALPRTVGGLDILAHGSATASRAIPIAARWFHCTQHHKLWHTCLVCVPGLPRRGSCVITSFNNGRRACFILETESQRQCVCLTRSSYHYFDCAHNIRTK